MLTEMAWLARLMRLNILGRYRMTTCVMPRYSYSKDLKIYRAISTPHRMESALGIFSNSKLMRLVGSFKRHLTFFTLAKILGFFMPI